MSYVKLWSLLSSSALISANHAVKLVMIHLLTKERHIFSSQRSLMNLRDVRTGQEERTHVNHVSDVKQSKNLIEFNQTLWN